MIVSKRSLVLSFHADERESPLAAVPFGDTPRDLLLAYHFKTHHVTRETRISSRPTESFCDTKRRRNSNPQDMRISAIETGDPPSDAQDLFLHPDRSAHHTESYRIHDINAHDLQSHPYGIILLLASDIYNSVAHDPRSHPVRRKGKGKAMLTACEHPPWRCPICIWRLAAAGTSFLQQ